MKQLFIMITLAVMMAACSQEGDSPVMPQQEASGAKTAIRSVDDAIAVAAQVADLGTQGRGARQLVDKSKVAIVTSRSSRSGTGDTLMYAIDFEDEQGFVLVAAPRCVEPLLAVTEKGSYTSYETSQNKGLQFALEAAQEYVAAKSVIQPPISSMFYNDTISCENNKIPARISVRWGQGWPENMHSPNSIAGCGPVAMAQILTYFKAPAIMSYTYSGRDINLETINWDDILKHKSSMSKNLPTSDEKNAHTNSCQLSAIGHKTIGRILRQLGQLSETNYNRYNATLSEPASMKAAMEDLLPNKQFTMGWTTVLVPNVDSLFDLIKQGGVACVWGDINKTSSIYDHIWVADGYKHYKCVYDIYGLSENAGEGYVFQQRVTDEKKYLHYNWGRNGYCNGYFLTSIFSPAKADEYDRFLGINLNDNTGFKQSDFKYYVNYFHIK